MGQAVSDWRGGSIRMGQGTAQLAANRAGQKCACLTWSRTRESTSYRQHHLLLPPAITDSPSALHTVATAG